MQVGKRFFLSPTHFFIPPQSCIFPDSTKQHLLVSVLAPSWKDVPSLLHHTHQIVTP